jgi:hypothetical protein
MFVGLKKMRGKPPVGLPTAKLLKSLTNGYGMGNVHLC